jgi:hypothetical protein
MGSQPGFKVGILFGTSFLLNFLETCLYDGSLLSLRSGLLILHIAQAIIGQANSIRSASGREFGPLLSLGVHFFGQFLPWRLRRAAVSSALTSKRWSLRDLRPMES